jgi:hypothetical protein
MVRPALAEDGALGIARFAVERLAFSADARGYMPTEATAQLEC